MAISRPAAPQKPVNRLCKSPANTKYMTLTTKKPVKVISQARHIPRPGNYSNGQLQQNPNTLSHPNQRTQKRLEENQRNTAVIHSTMISHWTWTRVNQVKIKRRVFIQRLSNEWLENSSLILFQLDS
uniref:Uncharacterized protein n=1 Tax=Salix viminalis TaxID=40686 RepID=A0A6N2L0Y5_SALVM